MPALPSYGYGREHPGPRYSSLIHGQNLVDVVITGKDKKSHYPLSRTTVFTSGFR